MTTKTKSQTLYQQYLNLNRAMAADNVSPERYASARATSNKLKVAIRAARLTEQQQRAVEQLRVLRNHTILTGFRTSRSQNEILATFTGGELADILEAVDAPVSARRESEVSQ